MPIQVLSEDVAAKIAAGEVIERPSSVVKELLENAIDAGASDIRVEIREGGVRLIRLTDDGCGIPDGEAETAFLRHATSKLRTPEDLDHIVTLGFRGEALASIAAVSQITLLTRTADEEVGTRLRLDGGHIVQKSGQGTPVGTSIAVENLFYNMPARRKFLRKPPTESAHIQALVTRHALAWPSLRISLQRDGRLAFQSTGSGNIMDVILKLYDLEKSRQLVEFRNEENGITAWGYASLPSLTRSDRNDLNVFVNRRWVQDRLLIRAVLDAYHGLLPSGRFPASSCTSNWTRAKWTSTFTLPKPRSVSEAAETFLPWCRKRYARPCVRPVRHAPAHIAAAGIRPGSGSEPLLLGRAGAAPLGTSGAGTPAHGRYACCPTGPTGTRTDELAPDDRSAPRNLPPLRVLGQLSQTFIIAEGPGGLYLIDQHTAHERVLYERFLSENCARASLSSSC